MIDPQLAHTRAAGLRSPGFRRCHALYGSQDSCPSPFIPTRQLANYRSCSLTRRFAFRRAKATVAVNNLAWAIFVADVGIGYPVAKPASMISPKSNWRGLGCCPAKGRGRNQDTTKVPSASARLVAAGYPPWPARWSRPACLRRATTGRARCAQREDVRKVKGASHQNTGRTAPSPGRGCDRRAKQVPTLAPLLREVILRSPDLVADGLRERDRGSLARGYLSLDPFNHLRDVTIVIANKAQRKHRSFDG